MSETTNLDIPKFTADDFLMTSAPFEWIIQKANGNEFVKKQLVAVVDAAARSVKITGFKGMFTEYERSLKGNVIIENNSMDFSGTSLAWDTGDWTACDDGIFKGGRYGEPMTFACRHPIFILMRYTNIETDAESVEIVYGRPGKPYKRKIVPRIDIASARGIVNLAKYGVSVTSENAKHLVQFLNDFENLNFDNIPERKSCDHFGWVGRGFSKFAPYISDLEFEGDEDFKHIFKALTPHGQEQKWLDLMRNYRAEGDKTVRIIMAASFASVLLKPLGALPFFVHLWGTSETGKTVALMAATSVWADPVIGHYSHTFKSTDVGNERKADCLKSLPLCMDELQIKGKQKDFDDTIYTLCEGVGKLRGKKEGGISKMTTWQNCILTTGEKPITTLSSGGGAVNRVIEIECNDGKFFKDPRSFCCVIQSNYGHAGKAFVDELMRDGSIETARSLYEKFIRHLEDKTEATDKQISAAAAILTADTLAEKWIFRDGITLKTGDIKGILKTRDMMNAERRAYEYLRDEMIVNSKMFGAEGTECWGTKDDKYVYVLRTRFNMILEKGGFNPTATLSWMAREGKIAKHDSGRKDYRKRISGGNVRTVCMYLDDKDNFEDIEDDTLPF